MKDIKTISLIAAIALSTILIIAANSAYMWLIVHGSEAEEFANYLLSETESPYPDWSVDMVVIKKKNIVTFSKHHSNTMFAYSPYTKPQSLYIAWSHAWGNWYIGNVKT